MIAPLLAAVLTVAPARAQTAEHVSFGRPIVVAAGQKAKEVVAIGAPVTVEGEVSEGVVAIGAPAMITGKVGGDLVVIGAAHLGPKAYIGGDAVVVGGTLDAEPGAVIKGERTVVAVAGAARLAAVPAVAAAGALHWLRYLGFFMVLLYAALALLAPLPVERCAAAVRGEPLTALLAGLLTAALAGPLSLVLIVTVLGIAVIPAVFIALIAGALVGKAGLYRAALSRSPLPPAGAVAAGALLAALLCSIPLAGWAVWALLTVWGLGAAALAVLETARAEGTKPAAPAPASAPAPVAAPAPSVPAAETLSLPRASFWLRLAATAIDVFAVAVIAAATPVLTFGLFAWALYQIGMWSWRGTTLGGVVCGIRGVRLDGRPMDLPVAAVRHVASWFSAFACFLGFLWAGWDAESQTWHDKIAGTVVVRLPKPEPLL